MAGARVVVAGREREILTTERGEFWCLVLPGEYRCVAYFKR